MSQIPYRYAIYFCPRPETALAHFGASWFAGDSVKVTGLTQDIFEALIADPWRYGFHGTLKPPFRLVADQSEDALVTSVQELARSVSPVLLDGLRLVSIGSFIALVPASPSESLRALASRCVMELDHFRAPPTEQELIRRRKSSLSAAQDELLKAWGYPYVLDEFRFHLTLTGAVEQTLRDQIISALAGRAADVLLPHEISDICICVESSPGASFELLHRVPLGVP